MTHQDKKIYFVVGAVVILILIAAAAVWLLLKQPAASPFKEQSAEEAPQTLGEEIFEQTQNPGQVLKEKLPEINPFQKATNPFQTETNPLKAQYENPFE